MNQSSSFISKLITLLQRQAKGSLFASWKIRALVKPFRQGEGSWFSHPEHTKPQSQCIEILYREWEGMFSYRPGRKEGLGPLIELFQWVENNHYADILALYNTSAWMEIGKLASPADTIIRVKCAKCGEKYPMLGTSGFMDIIGVICDTCGHALFRSIHDESILPPCRCGGKFCDFCPRCGSKDFKIISEKSPYQYFSKHGFTWESG